MLKLQFNKKRLKRIPRKQKIICVLMGIICILLFVNLFFPDTGMLNNSVHKEIQIINVRKHYNFSKKGASSTQWYTIYSSDCNYYLSFHRRSDVFNIFQCEVEEDLLSRQISSVSVIVTKKQTLQDFFRNRYRILSLRIDGTEYLSLEQSKELLTDLYMGTWFLFLLMGFISIVHIIIIALCYGVLELDGKAKAKSAIKQKNK